MRIERSSISLELDSRGKRVLKTVNHALGTILEACTGIDVYLIEGIPELTTELIEEIFLDSVAQRVCIDREAVGDILPQWDLRIEVAYKPGVTDPEALTAREAIELSLEHVDTKAVIQTARQYVFRFCRDEAGKVEQWAPRIAGLLHNSLVEVATWMVRNSSHKSTAFPSLYPSQVAPSRGEVERIPLQDLSGEELEVLSRKRLLALSREEMEAIQAYYRDPKVRKERERLGLGSSATDVELEMIAQTWSEHCKHKIFAAQIQYRERNIDGNLIKEERINSLFQTYIKDTTRWISQNRKDLRSVFHDNSGVVDFDEEYLVCMKVETHNSPSALDPYGGAITGIVGVNRDILGTGLGARPIFNTNVLCFDYPDTPSEEIPPPLIHPRRLLLGVHRGILDGGNQSGIPTVGGAFLFDESYRGKPLVFCGTGGILPRNILGKPSWEKRIDPGDLAVMAGGRIGKDGIHGATFSSAALEETSPSSAVQIGDPITQKKLSDFLLEARDRGLFKALTDNGAGGLSSSLGEMAQLCGGVRIFLDRCPLKYPGLAPWEILLSESQERMSFAVGKDQIEEFLALAKERGVEATVVGEFTHTGLVEVYDGPHLVGCLDLTFLHDGVPRMKLVAEWVPPRGQQQGLEDSTAEHTIGFSAQTLPNYDRLKEVLLKLLQDPNIASKESLVRQYDHEVQGSSIVKPFMGVAFDAPMDGAVIRPRYDSYRGITVTHGIKPRYSDLDPYAMALAVVDEAYRSHIALGGNPNLASALDNFCWPDPIPSPQNPDGSFKLAQLVRACKGLQEACLAYELPLISGKDSMKNDALIGEKKLSVRPTLLVTVMGIIEDVRKAITTDFKREGDLIYLLGRTTEGLGGTYLEHVLGKKLGDLPYFDLKEARTLYLRLHEVMVQGLVSSCHDISDGGLAVAVCESSLGGRLGATITLRPDLMRSQRSIRAIEEAVGTREILLNLLFGEGPGRFVVSVAKKDREAFENAFKGYPCYSLGTVTRESTLQFLWEANGSVMDLLEVSLKEVEEAWKSFSKEIIA
ncbi:MAG: AIR synthase-related protein [Spirochaetes bacterium]|nr:AIR synthase-related protein [Spirochaetota bacterium]